VKCFSTSFHTGLLLSPVPRVDYWVFPSVFYTWWARCPLQWPRIETRTCPSFFWSTRLAKIWHLRDMIHHIADD
jgi:hypothetical protein